MKHCRRGVGKAGKRQGRGGKEVGEKQESSEGRWEGGRRAGEKQERGRGGRNRGKRRCAACRPISARLSFPLLAN